MTKLAQFRKGQYFVAHPVDSTVTTETIITIVNIVATVTIV